MNQMRRYSSAVTCADFHPENPRIFRGPRGGGYGVLDSLEAGEWNN
jgi:hypothetical protein